MYGYLIKDKNNFAIYPNPSSGMFTISSNAKSNQHYVVSFYDMVGRLAKQIEWRGDRTSVDLTSFPKGIYNVRLTNGKENKFKKLIIE